MLRAYSEGTQTCVVPGRQQHPSVGVLQCSKLFHKVIHNISLGQTQTQTSGDNRRGSVTRRLPLHQLLPIQRGASLHGDERRAAWLKPRCNPAQRLALPALFLVFPRMEVGLAAGGEGRDRCAALGLYGEDVGLEREGVDELGVWEAGSDQSEDELGGYANGLPVGAAGEMMSGDLHMRLRSLEGGGCPVEVLPGKMITLARERG
jgi:hypothetical protein